MRMFLMASLSLLLSACYGGDNLTLIETSGVAAASFQINPDMTPRITGIGSAGSMYMNGPMVRKDKSAGDYTLVKTPGWCGNENYVSYMIVAESSVSMKGVVDAKAELNKGLYGGHTSDIMAMAKLAEAMNGAAPSFMLDCSKTKAAANTLARGGRVSSPP